MTAQVHKTWPNSKAMIYLRNNLNLFSKTNTTPTCTLIPRWIISLLKYLFEVIFRREALTAPLVLLFSSSSENRKICGKVSRVLRLRDAENVRSRSYTMYLQCN